MTARAANLQPPREPFSAVYFDCDSTLSSIEGIDELLEFAPPELRREIAEMTDRAMDGTLPLADVYEQRLQMLAPRREHLLRIGQLYRENATLHACETIAALRFLGKRVGIISGGLLPAVQDFAQHLGIDEQDVHAVPIRFAPDGCYVDFDRNCPLWRNQGKIEVLQSLPTASRPLLFTGDGVTDLEVQGIAADRFVGFGGVKDRARVREAAEFWFATRSLAPLLHAALTTAELARLADHPTFGPLLSAAGR